MLLKGFYSKDVQTRKNKRGGEEVRDIGVGSVGERMNEPSERQYLL